MISQLCDEEWALLKRLLPTDLDERAKTCHALRRARGVKDAETLLRLLFLHISGGLSLEQTALRAATLGIAKVSAVALFKRLRGARSWLEDLCAQLISKHTTHSPVIWPLPGRTYRVLDASDIREPGAAGSSWRLHYSITLPGLRCDFARFTPHTVGERLQNLPLQKTDIVLADRAYGKRGQMAWLIDCGADAVIRLHPPSFPIMERHAEDTEATDLPVDWLARLDTLPPLQPAEWIVGFSSGTKRYKIRICAIRKSATAAAQARHKVQLEARKKGRVSAEQTLRMADFIVIATTLSARALSTARVLELYRCRWQVELAFKRLKSLLDMSAVPKTDEQSARSWMQGKLLESLLIERLLEQSRALSPWGYEL